MIHKVTIHTDPRSLFRRVLDPSDETARVIERNGSSTEEFFMDLRYKVKPGEAVFLVAMVGSSYASVTPAYYLPTTADNDRFVDRTVRYDIWGEDQPFVCVAVSTEETALQAQYINGRTRQLTDEDYEPSFRTTVIDHTLKV